MKSYYIDANVFLRFLLKDDTDLYTEAESFLRQASDGKIKIVLLSEILLEINYVLRSVYSLNRKEIAEKLSSIIKTPYIQVPDRTALIEALEKYKKINVDLADLILYEKAEENGAEVFTFDATDFKKIGNYFPN